MARRVAVAYSERRVIRDGVTWLFTAERYAGTVTLQARRWNGYYWATEHNITL